MRELIPHTGREMMMIMIRTGTFTPEIHSTGAPITLPSMSRSTMILIENPSNPNLHRMNP